MNIITPKVRRSRAAGLRRKDLRVRVWKGLNIIVAAVTLMNVSAIGSLMAPKIAEAATGSLWTTRSLCIHPAPQDENEYAAGDTVTVRADGLDIGTQYWGKITGQNGSADPSEVVAQFSGTAIDVNGSGYLCVDAYVVGSDGDLDSGVYTVDLYDNSNYDGTHGNFHKNDNYHVNALVGNLTVNKVVDSGSASADDFDFTITPDPYGVGTFSTTNGSRTFANLPVGNYTIDEVDGPNNYHMVSNDCDVDVVNGQTVSCTVHNARDTRDIKIVKEVVGGSAQASDWTFDLNNDETSYTDIHSGDVVSVFTGTYALSENGPGGYVMTDVEGNCYQDGGTFLYTNTEGPAICTVTNTAVPHTMLTVHKMLDNGSGTYSNIDATANTLGFHWGLAHADGLDLNSQWGVATDFGTANIGDGVTESHPAGYTFQGWFYGTDGSCTSTGEGFHQPGSSVFVQSGSSATITLCNVKDPVAPVLSITKVNSVVNFTNPGTTVTYTVVVTNASSSTVTAQNVMLSDLLPSGFTFTGGASTQTFSLGNIAPGASVTTTYTVGISASEAAGTYTNTATATGDNTNTVSAQSNVEVRVPVVLGASTPELSITKSVNKTDVTPGQGLTYTIVVTNTGDSSASNVVLTDELPEGFVYLQGGGTTKTWNLGTMAAGASQTITYDVTVGPQVTAGQYTNRAFVVADGFDPLSAQATVNVHVPQVLGLATSGVSTRDYLTFGFGLMMLALGFISFNALKRNPEPEQE